LPIFCTADEVSCNICVNRHEPRGVNVLLQTELENGELRLSYSRPERTSLDER
jgi:hypothetical protein